MKTARLAIWKAYTALLLIHLKFLYIAINAAHSKEFESSPCQRLYGHEISCSLEHVCLSEPRKYTALSSCWGDSHDKVTIRVDDQSFQVTRNLKDALERLYFINITRLCVGGYIMPVSGSVPSGVPRKI